MARPRVAGQRRGPTPGQALRQQVAAMAGGITPPTAEELAPFLENRAKLIAEHGTPESPSHDDYLAWAQQRAERIVADGFSTEAWAHIIDTWDELSGDETLEIVMFFAQAYAPLAVDEPVDDEVEVAHPTMAQIAELQQAVAEIQQAQPAPARALRGARLVPADGPIANPAPATVPPDVPRGMKPRVASAPPAASPEDAGRAAQIAAEDAERRQRKQAAMRDLGVQQSPIPPQLDPAQLASDRPTRPSGHNLPPEHQWKRDGSGRRIAPEGF